jgi:hypothetical protein
MVEASGCRNFVLKPRFKSLSYSKISSKLSTMVILTNLFANQEHALITKQSQNYHNQPPYEGDKKVTSTFLNECENFHLLLLDF